MKTKTNKIATLLVMTILLLSSPLTAVAQPRGMGSPEKFADHMVSKLQDRLELSDEQANKLATFVEESTEQGKCHELATYSERRDCRATKKEACDAKILSILNDAQKVKFEEFKKEREERKGMHGKMNQMHGE